MCCVIKRCSEVLGCLVAACQGKSQGQEIIACPSWQAQVTCFLIMLIIYHCCLVALQPASLPLFLNSWRGAFKDAPSICCFCCGQLPQGQPGRVPVVSMLNNLLNWDLKSWCGPLGYQVALASSCIFQYNSQWLGNTTPAGLLAAHHAECTQSYDAFY